ncbi:uncharacterized protein EI97DRAFT_463405 [Westerdykella ornata]|uniref:Uncharacterized protein n=1 Tax=Westerdykella ornata TaxID=318751 RepID=A0A6A6JXP7_WESOR|nr:uncharacterized protein EI97DRAFT_463405 [Westerdykella ornata]KAF2280995.1 hypothetical protein EI97DRAFT_463405 [Westerdykella ornata]
MPRRPSTITTSRPTARAIIYTDIDTYITELEAQNARQRLELESLKSRHSLTWGSRLNTFLPSWKRLLPFLLASLIYFFLLDLSGTVVGVKSGVIVSTAGAVLKGNVKLAEYSKTTGTHDFWLGVDGTNSRFHKGLTNFIHRDGKGRYPFTRYPFGNLTLANLGFIFADPWSVLNISPDHVLHPLYRGNVSDTEWEDGIQDAEDRAVELARPWKDSEACDESDGWYVFEACALGGKKFQSAVECLREEKCRVRYSRWFKEGGLGARYAGEGKLTLLDRGARLVEEVVKPLKVRGSVEQASGVDVESR